VLNEFSYEEFVKLYERGEIVSVYREMFADRLTPIAAYHRLCLGKRRGFLLEKPTNERYSYIGCDPFLTLRIRGHRIQVEKKDETFVLSGTPLNTIRKLFSKYRRANIQGFPPFVGGIVGYIGFDAYRWQGEISDPYLADNEIDDAALMFCHRVAVYDHRDEKITVILSDFPDQKSKKSVKERFEGLQIGLDKLEDRLFFSTNMTSTHSTDPASIPLKPLYDADIFFQMIEQARRRLAHSGLDSLVLSNPLCARPKTPPFDLYRALRLNDRSSVSSTYLHIDQQNIMGFRQRPLLDIRGGKIYRPGDDRKIEKKLPRGVDGFDLLFKKFPSPEVCGEPRTPALESIDVIERHRRGSAGGVIIASDFGGNFYATVPSVTAGYAKGKFTLHPFHRITADTDPKAISQQCQDQANALETMFRFIQEVFRM